jgi:hypothetical protein
MVEGVPDSKAPMGADYARFIDVSLLKLSALQRQGKSRSERHIIVVLELLQRALTGKIGLEHGESKKGALRESGMVL